MVYFPLPSVLFTVASSRKRDAAAFIVFSFLSLKIDLSQLIPVEVVYFWYLYANKQKIISQN